MCSSKDNVNPLKKFQQSVSRLTQWPAHPESNGIQMIPKGWCTQTCQNHNQQKPAE